MENVSGDALVAAMVEPKRRSAPVDFLVRLVKEKPLGTLGAIITLLLLFTCVFAGVLAPVAGLCSKNRK